MINVSTYFAAIVHRIDKRVGRRSFVHLEGETTATETWRDDGMKQGLASGRTVASVSP